VSHAEECINHFEIIRDYNRRPVMATRLRRIAEDVNYFSNAIWQHALRSQLMIPALASLIVAVLMGAAPFLIEHYGYTAGQFLAALTAMESVALEAVSLHDSLLDMQLSLSALLKVRFYMNLPSEVPERMLANRKQRERGRKEFNLAAAAHALGRGAPIGAQDIELKGARLLVPSQKQSNGPSRESATFNPLIQAVNLKMEQGKMYAVVGLPSNGKASLLRLLAKVIYPGEGEVYVPPHVHIVHVEAQAHLMRQFSLYDNLTFGYRFERPSLERVCAVCESIGLPAKWIRHMRQQEASSKGGIGIKSNRSRGKSIDEATKTQVDSAETQEQATEWQRTLSSSEVRLISIARAIITDPHLLVLHRPLAGLDEHLALRVLETLREFVDNRGVHMGDEEGSNQLGELRTVVFTCSTLDEHAIEAVDETIVVGQSHMRSELAIEKITSQKLRRAGTKMVNVLKMSCSSVLHMKSMSKLSAPSPVGAAPNPRWSASADVVAQGKVGASPAWLQGGADDDDDVAETVAEDADNGGAAGEKTKMRGFSMIGTLKQLQSSTKMRQEDASAEIQQLL